MVAEIDIADETFLVAEPSQVAAVFADPETWRAWWPGLELTPVEDRAEQGQRWTLSAPLAGTAEIWLEPWADGVIVHWFLRARFDAPATESTRRRVELIRRHKRHIHALKDRLETTRPPGVPRAPATR